MNGPGSQGRMMVALLLLAGSAIGVALTMEPGKYRSVAWLLLGFFAFRVVIGRVHRQQAERDRLMDPGSGTGDPGAGPAAKG